LESLFLLTNTLLLRPYVFVFLAVSVYIGQRLLGWGRTGRLFGLTWATAFICEYASTRIGIPFGQYFYTGTTRGIEVYIFNIPFMDSLSFSFLLFASYCLALIFVLPPGQFAGRYGLRFDSEVRTSWRVIGLTIVFFTFSDVVIDPVALQGDRWFLGKIYGYPHEAVYFGVPLMNFVGWAIVGFLSLSTYRWLECGLYVLDPIPREDVKYELLLGIGLFYGILAFTLSVTFWIGEMLMGILGCFIFIPLTSVLLNTLWQKLSSSRLSAQ
jgi:uncharacterized membrane protein